MGFFIPQTDNAETLSQWKMTQCCFRSIMKLLYAKICSFSVLRHYELTSVKVTAHWSEKGKCSQFGSLCGCDCAVIAMSELEQDWQTV